jgi:GH18 family chitinase
VAAKATYVRAHGLRGMAAWEIGMDDASHSLLDSYATALRTTTG